MSYVDAGYTVALVVLSAYALSLVARRRRLTRAADLCAPAIAASPAGGTAGTIGLDATAGRNPGAGRGETAGPDPVPGQAAGDDR